MTHTHTICAGCGGTFGQHDPDDLQCCDLWDPTPAARTPP